MQSIYIVLSIISNYTADLKYTEAVHRLYANTMPFYIRDLSILGFWYPWGRNGGLVLEPIPRGYLRTTVLELG